MKPYKIDTDVLANIAKEAVGSSLEGGELLDRVVEMISAEYPDLVAPTRGRWIGNKAGGILGKVSMVYFTPREYVVLFGSPTGTQGFSGRYKHVEIHKFLLAGQVDSYDLESDQIAPTVLRPGERACLEKGRIRGFTIHPGSWHLEYGRGAVATTLPFAMAETLLTSLELPSVVLSAKEFIRLVRRRPGR